MGTQLMNRPGGTASWTELPLRGPSVFESRRWRLAVTALAVAGAGCTLWSGVIHLYLWGETNGFREIPTIGPLFLIQGISAILLALAVLATRRAIVLLAAAGLLAGTALGLIISVEHGLFGWRDSWSAPYTVTSLYYEFGGAAVLLIAVAMLLFARPLFARPRGD